VPVGPSDYTVLGIARPRSTRPVVSLPPECSRAESSRLLLPALHIAGDDQKIGRVAQEAVNRWNDHNIGSGKSAH
jgi:hypothetical protein